MIDAVMDEEKIKQDKLYLDYIKTHKLKVLKAYEEKFLPLVYQNDITLNSVSLNELKQAIINASNNIYIHDESKCSDIEFDAYRVYHYPTNLERSRIITDYDFSQSRDLNYQEAWIHHYKNNPHHPEYWIGSDGVIKDMDLIYIIEMICDWMSFGDNAGEWYNKKAAKEKACMNNKTRTIVEELLFKVFYKES